MSRRLSLLQLVHLLLHPPGAPGEAVQHSLECSDSKPTTLCLTKGYSTFDLPFRHQENMVKIGFEISDVLAINDKDYSITFSLYFSVEWLEPRLNLSMELWGEENVAREDELVPVNLELIKSLWVPNIFIYNLKTFKTIDVLSKLAGLWIDKRKRIYYSQATHITFICPMLFDSFPLDTQRCKFQVGSYSYDMSRMVFDVSTLGYIQHTQSIILDYAIVIRNLKKTDKIFDAAALGNFSLAGFEMSLSRHVMSYIITYYLPSGLFVVVSWISFLIPPEVVPGRMALLITLFLVLVNIFNNVTTNSPKAEGLTAIEIWMLACILFVFGALIEYAMILNQKQKMVLPRPPPSNPVQTVISPVIGPHKQGPEANGHGALDSNGQVPHLSDGPDGKEASVLLSVDPGQPPISVVCKTKNQGVKERQVVEKLTPSHYHYAMVDRFFLFLSPLLFLIFNTIYWGYFWVWDIWFLLESENEQV